MIYGSLLVTFKSVWRFASGFGHQLGISSAHRIFLLYVQIQVDQQTLKVDQLVDH